MVETSADNCKSFDIPVITPRYLALLTSCSVCPLIVYSFCKTDRSYHCFPKMDAFENSGYYYYYYKICIAHKFKHARVGGAVVTLYGNN